MRLIVSKFKVKNGHGYFAITDKNRDSAELSFFTDANDLNVHEVNEWESFDGTYLKGQVLGFWVKNVNVQYNYGLNTHLMKMSDIKTVKAELNNVLLWLLKTLKLETVIMRPMDDRRLEATRFLLKNMDDIHTASVKKDDEFDGWHVLICLKENFNGAQL
jgi:hypothetical protein